MSSGEAEGRQEVQPRTKRGGQCGLYPHWVPCNSIFFLVLEQLFLFVQDEQV